MNYLTTWSREDKNKTNKSKKKYEKDKQLMPLHGIDNRTIFHAPVTRVQFMYHFSCCFVTALSLVCSLARHVLHIIINTHLQRCLFTILAASACLQPFTISWETRRRRWQPQPLESWQVWCHSIYSLSCIYLVLAKSSSNYDSFNVVYANNARTLPHR